MFRKATDEHRLTQINAWAEGGIAHKFWPDQGLFQANGLLKHALSQSVFICVDLWLLLFWALKNRDAPCHAVRQK